jgi:multidrug resistance protein MdtO
MSGGALLRFLRRELAPTPGRGAATFRLTLACVAATIPILTHRIPHALLVMVVMYLITQEDTAATLIGSILAVIGATVGLGLALLALKIALDVPPLRLACFVAFFFGGLFLKRVLTLGALGSVLGLPAALAMIVPDLGPASPESVVEFVLWLWWCITLGLSVNVGVQLLLSPGDPLTLLRRELDMRLHAVEQALRRAAGADAAAPPAAPLARLTIAGMSRPLALLKTATIVHRWARDRREPLAALITLIDRLVTAAHALEALEPPSGEEAGARFLRAAEGCLQMRRAFQHLRRPEAGEWVALSQDLAGGRGSPLTEIEETLDEIALAGPGRSEKPGVPGAPPEKRPSLFVPDAFHNPEYVRFALKGTLAGLICYVLFVGFDYPGIYTSVITCFVVSLSTVGASNQKGILRFGGAAAGGAMGLVALVYLLPEVESLGGFWLVFGAGTAAAAWVNFGSPRISYGGYQTGLAFYKAVLQGFGTAVSATVVRDRLIGVFFGLVVFGIVEHVLWPVHAREALRTRLAEALRLLADLARSRTNPQGSVETLAMVDPWRRRISQKMEEVQMLIESSKFERDAMDLDALQRRTGDAQVVFVLLLALSRHEPAPGLPTTVQTTAFELDIAITTALEALATRAVSDAPAAVPELEGALDALERAAHSSLDAPGKVATTPPLAGTLALYRSLVASVTRLSPAPLAAATAS